MDRRGVLNDTVVISEGRLQTVSSVMKLYGHILAGVWLGAWKKCYAALAAWFECFGNQEICKQADERILTHPCRRPPDVRGVFDTDGDPAKVKYEPNGVLLILAALPSSLVGSSRFYALVTFAAKSPESH